MLKIDAKRHLAKTITWRIVGTLDTILLSWFISGDPLIGLSIGGAEVFTKMILYFLHERAWYKYGFGIKRPRKTEKSITWSPDNSRDLHVQVAFLQDENNNHRTRLKVTRNSSGVYRALVSYKDKENDVRVHDMFEGTKAEIETNFNISIED